MRVLLHSLNRPGGLGATLELHGEGIKVKAPAPLPTGMMDELRHHKADIVDLREAQANVTTKDTVSEISRSPGQRTGA